MHCSYFCILILLLGLLSICPPVDSHDGASLDPQVDERTELLGIVFHLAGLHEYNEIQVQNYNDEINKYFAPFNKHEAVMYAKWLHEKHGVGYNAPMAFALDLAPAPNLTPPAVPFSAKVPEDRFGKADSQKFVQKLRAFYRDSNFSEFYKAHKDLYNEEEKKARKALSDFNIDWFDRFFQSKKSPRSFHLIISLTCGGNNFGYENNFPDGHSDIFGVIGAEMIPKNAEDKEAKLDFQSVLAHEFTHSITNPLVDKHLNELQPAISVIFHYVSEQMKEQAYPEPTTMVYDTLARVGSKMYLDDNGHSNMVLDDVRMDQQLGFVFMDELVTFVKTNYRNRDKYPDFDSFMPEVAKFFQYYATLMPAKIEALKNNTVHVVNLDPPINHQADMKSEIKQLVINFDHEMDPDRFSIMYGPGGAETYPIAGHPEFINHNKALRIEFSLKADHKYEFELSPLAFRGTNGFPLEKYSVEFKTAR